MPLPPVHVVLATLASLLLWKTPSVLISQDHFTPVFVVPRAHVALLCSSLHTGPAFLDYRSRVVSLPSLLPSLLRFSVPAPHLSLCCSIVFFLSSEEYKLLKGSVFEILCSLFSLSLEQCPTHHRNSINRCWTNEECGENFQNVFVGFLPPWSGYWLGFKVCVFE